MRTTTEDVFNRKLKRGGGRKYDYDAMSDGKPYILDRGEDFPENISGIAAITALRNGFKKRNLHIRATVLSEDEIVIQVTGRIHNV